MMNFLCDVHISYKLVKYLNSIGFNAIHVNEILDKWLTTDEDICKHTDKNNLVVLSKDSDFKNSFYVNNTPKKLIKINLGNISTNDLIEVFSKHKNELEIINLYEAFIIEIDHDRLFFNVPE